MKIKAFTIFLLSVFSCMMLNAQTWSLEADPVRDNEIIEPGKEEIVDTSIMECVYEHLVRDPVIKKRRRKNYILEIGKNATRYSVYGTYQRDSIVAADYPDGITWGKFSQLSKMYDAKLSDIIRYRDNNRIVCHDNVFMDDYVYEEPTIDMGWEPVNETDEICGYKCLKATCSFRGREWTAWYCPEIEIDGGPWKFCGLPGLILKVVDSEKEHVFEAFQIRKSNKEFGYLISKSDFKTDRKTFNKMHADFYTDPGAFLEGNPLMPTTLDGKPAIKKGKRRFYNPIERD